MLKKTAFFAPVLLAFLPLAFFKSELTIFPNNEHNRIISYGDEDDSTGNSLHTLTKATDSVIVLDYTLRKANPPSGKPLYAGLAIRLKEKDGFRNITPYAYLDVDIITKQGTSFNVQLQTFIEGLTVFENFRTYHTETYQVMVHIGSKRYRIPLDSFNIPDWWYTELFKELGAKAASLPRSADKTKWFGINFQSGLGTAENVPDRFEITRVAFVKDRKGLLNICAGCSLGYCIAAFFVSFFMRKRNKRPQNGQTLAYTQLDIQNHSDEEIKRLTDYIGAHFQEPELTVEDLGRETGITPTKVPLILQQKFNKPFKPYLNEIRIMESKRLLRETDRTITEIAFAVGYNNVTHFNRVFRQCEGIAPTVYRENQKKI